MLGVIKFFFEHPLTKNNPYKAVKRFLRWQIFSRLVPYPVVFPFIGQTTLLVQRGFRSATANMYVGLMEFEEMAFLLHFLNHDDLFIDIGANVGVYTVLASGNRKARTIAIEPIPATFSCLEQNIALNKIHDKVMAYNIGLGSKRDKLKFTSNWDTLNNVITEENLAIEKHFVEVEVHRLDDLIDKTEQPNLIKIDV